jgi:hypothetical protein
LIRSSLNKMPSCNHGCPRSGPDGQPIETSQPAHVANEINELRAMAVGLATVRKSDRFKVDYRFVHFLGLSYGLQLACGLGYG